MGSTREEKEFRGFGFFPAKEPAPSAEMMKTIEKGKKIFLEEISSLPEINLAKNQRSRYGQEKKYFVAQFGITHGFLALGSGQVTLLEAYELFKISKYLISKSGMSLLKAVPISQETIKKMQASEYYIDSIFCQLMMHGQEMLENKLITYDITLSFLPYNQGGCCVLKALLSKNSMCAVNEGLIVFGSSEQRNVFSLDKLLEIAASAEQTQNPTAITYCLEIILTPHAREAIQKKLYPVEQIMDFLTNKNIKSDKKILPLQALFSNFGIKAVEACKKEIQELPDDKKKLLATYLLIKSSMLENIQEEFKPLIQSELIKAETLKRFIDSGNFNDLDLLCKPSSFAVLQQNESVRVSINSVEAFYDGDPIASFKEAVEVYEQVRTAVCKDLFDVIHMDRDSAHIVSEYVGSDMVITKPLSLTR